MQTPGPDIAIPAAGDALVIVDVQRDFLPGGALPVPGGDQIVPVLNRYLERFTARSLPVFATRDWHPADHVSFRAQGGPWPPHCVQGTAGAAFADGLRLPPTACVVSKATCRDRDSYSDFDAAGFEAQLRARGVRRLFVGGLAADYCVRATVRDALERGFAVVLLTDAVRALDVAPGDGERAVAEMQRLGAVVTTLQERA